MMRHKAITTSLMRKRLIKSIRSGRSSIATPGFYAAGLDIDEMDIYLEDYNEACEQLWAIREGLA